ncbi:DTYMK [Cordylochernes scorpioides]|uniref:dTMP kinase n=1 Tax=Cordylochernes scorpioides TaxID=51811 RepID=A0ABY6L9P2_9ARAC|nr:DTYMK [Cordylochernes scorpioides]
MARGAFIVLEGLDRTGKTTQCMKLVNSLVKNNYEAKMLRFPERDTEIGNLISNYLTSDKEFNDRTIHLLFSANRWEMADKIKKLINSGTTLIVDRYSYSGVAFSYAKKHLDLKWCMQPECGLPKPDLVLFLDLSIQELEKRGGFGNERYEKPEFQSRVREAYSQIKEDYWEIVNANDTLENLHNILYEKVKKTSVEALLLRTPDVDLTLQPILVLPCQLERLQSICQRHSAEHPAYSPDLAPPPDYFLFGLLKKELMGKRFDSDEDVQKVVQDFFHTLPKSAYKEGIYKLPERWRQYIESQGDYSRTSLIQHPKGSELSVELKEVLN